MTISDISSFQDLLALPVIEQLLEYGGSLLSGLVIILLGFWVSGRISGLIRRRLSAIKSFDATLTPVIASIIRYIILLVAFVAGLGSFGIETTSIIAVIGAAGLAIGLALQGTLSNVASGGMLLFLRPFKVGDWMETGTVSGTVDEIGIFSTVINTFDNIYISVPNSSIWGSIIINHSKYNTRRMDLDIGISYETDLDYAEKTLMALVNDERVLTEPEPQFLVVAYADSAITVRLRLYANVDTYFPLYWDMMRKIKPALDDAGIGIPYPQRDIRIVSSSSTETHQ
ncbi:MAG: small-conductance mechanosensitive channel [Candidatus Puniceispirillum sp. TMED52]|nr:small-conductance mechanosensitive channel [SAR116 cluster bacterium]OUU46526.1 MAG: small-conductance mechanosensitive channel [Candidatus Puniceispirillum sp. TMED52]